MNYYKDHYVLQTLSAKQREYASAKEIALREIYQHLHDADTALSLLRRFMSRYCADNTIFLSVNDIALRLRAFDILVESTSKALAHDKQNAQAHYDFGTLLFDPENAAHEDFHDVLLRYLQFTAQPDSDDDASLSSQSDVNSALDLIDSKFKVAAEKTHDYIKYGNFLVFGRRLQKAAIAFKQATTLQPDSAIAYRNLSLVFRLLDCTMDSQIAMGHASFAERKYALAIESYSRALALGASPDICERLTQSYLHQGQFSEAAAICAEAMVRTETAMLYTLWIDALQSTNQVGRALELAERAYATFPQERYFKFQARLILPVIYKSQLDISHHRTRFCQTLRAWSVKCQADGKYASGSAIHDIKGTNFYLPYQGQCDLEIQKEYGYLLHRVVTETYPQFRNGSRKRAAKKTRIRVGYISAFCSWHTVGKLFLGWVQQHDSQMFEVHVYHLGHKVDFLSRSFEAASARFVHLTGHDLEKICECIQADDLDILVHLEFGMRPVITKIAALRLAPIQCVAWGHPVTSGLPTIDYFLSSEMMEPPDGDNHYSEALVRLPNIGVCVPTPLKAVSNRTRADYGLSDNRTVYVFPHSLFKQLPQYDWVFPAIAKQNPRSEFVLIERETHSVEAARAFEARIAEAFRQHNLNASDHIRFVSQQGLQDFLTLLSLSDVYLDCIGWSGGMTTLEALGCMLPIVTMPGQFMRGRHAYGCLQRIGIDETVAHSAEDYVNVSSRLGLDEAWRNAILSKQAANLHRLYDDRECVVALEKFYRAVAMM